MPTYSYLQTTGANSIRKAVDGDFSTWLTKGIPVAGAYTWIVSDTRQIAAVLADKADPCVSYSLDAGDTWAMASIGRDAGNAPRGLFKLGDYFVVVDDDANMYVASRTNPASWTKYLDATPALTINPTNPGMGAAWRRSTNTAVIMTEDISEVQYMFQRSIGVATWSGAWGAIPVSGPGKIFNMHCINDAVFVAVGTRVIYSNDNGATWTVLATVFNFQFSVLVESGTKIIAIDNTGDIWETTDGASWADTGFDAPYLPKVDPAYKGFSRAVYTEADGIVAILDHPSNLSQTLDLGENWIDYASSNFQRAIALINVPIEPIEGVTEEDGTVELPGIDESEEWELCVQASALCTPRCFDVTIPPDGVMAITGPDGIGAVDIAVGEYTLSVQPFSCESPYSEIIDV